MSEKLLNNPLLVLPSQDILLDGQPIYKDVFEVIKEEVESMSEQEATMQRLGVLTDLLPKAAFKGNISRATRLESGEITEEGITEANERLFRSYVPTFKGKSIRCVDGRTELGYDDTEPNSYELGPQVQGGTVDIAVAMRLSKGNAANATLEQDIDAAAEAMGTDYLPAGHTDDHAPAGGYGCGAVKGQEDKLAYYQDSAIFTAVKEVVGALYGLDGKTLSQETLKDLPEQAAELAVNQERYFAGKPAIIDYLKQFNADAKKVVAGTHNEYALALNFVRGTTLNTGKFNAGSDGQYQAFGLDVWYIVDQFGDAAPYVLVDALATVLNLTDGSIEVEARLPAAV